MARTRRPLLGNDEPLIVLLRAIEWSEMEENRRAFGRFTEGWQPLDEFQKHPTHFPNFKGQKLLPTEFARSKAEIKNEFRP